MTLVCVCVCLAAGNAFCQAARLHMQLQNKLDSATSFVDAGNAYKKADPQGERKPSFTFCCPKYCPGVGHNIKYYIWYPFINNAMQNYGMPTLQSFPSHV